MKRWTCFGLSFLVFGLPGCGTPAQQQPSASLVSISMSPTSALVGSPDVTLRVTGKHFAGGDCAPNCPYSVVVWSESGTNTNLATRFVSNTLLTATVPAGLMTHILTANVFVQTFAGPGDPPLSATRPVLFSVTTAPAKPVTITLISPATATVGSSAITLTISGENFNNQFLDTSVAFWTITGNLHDDGTMLATTFVSSSELTAVIPAALLQKPISVQIIVVTGDPMGMSDGYFGYPKSNALTFTVSP